MTYRRVGTSDTTLYERNDEVPLNTTKEGRGCNASHDGKVGKRISITDRDQSTEAPRLTPADARRKVV